MRYIGSIQRQNGMLVISGVIGVRRYLWYSKREAIVRYNQECREKLQPEHPSINGEPRFEEGDAVKVISKKSKSMGIPALSPATATGSIGRFAGSF